MGHANNLAVYLTYAAHPHTPYTHTHTTACTKHNEANGNGNIKYCNKLAFVPAHSVDGERGKRVG